MKFLLFQPTTQTSNLWRSLFVLLLPKHRFVVDTEALMLYNGYATLVAGDSTLIERREVGGLFARFIRC